MNKLTIDQWKELTREEKREALLNFKAPDSIVWKENYLQLNMEKI